MIRSSRTKEKSSKEFRIKSRTIDKENYFSDHIAYKQSTQNSQRASEMRVNKFHQYRNCNSKTVGLINKQKQTQTLASYDTISLLAPIKSPILSRPPIQNLFCNINHKLTQQPNIHIWNQLIVKYQKQKQKDCSWKVLYQNIDSKINGEQCCIKIARRQNPKGNKYYIIMKKLNQKIHVSFIDKEWKKITKAYRTYQQIQESIYLSSDNKIRIPINLDSQAISEHLKVADQTDNFENIQFL